MKTEETGEDDYEYLDPKPLRISQWHDPQSTATGWLVIDRRVNGVAGGGVFMWSGATARETADIAGTMSKKFAICPNPIGGAKAGVRCDLTEPGQRYAVLQRFLREMHSELGEWVTAGDYGTADSIIERLVRDLTGQDMQWALYRCVAGGDQKRALELSRRAPDLYGIDMSSAFLPPGMPRPEFDFPFIEAAVGYGIVESILAVLTKLDARRLALARPLEDIRVAVQGAGAVGTGVMLYSSRLGAKIVAVSDMEGVIYDPEGLDIEKLLTFRSRAIASLADGVRTQAGKLLTPYVLGRTDRPARVATNAEINAQTRDARGVDGKLGHILKNASSVDVFVAAASRYLLNESAIDIASEGMWKGTGTRIMVAGANNPLGAQNGSGSPTPPTRTEINLILRRMREKKVIFVPDFRANGGTAQLFHCYASGNLNAVFEGVPTGIPVLSAEKQQLALHITSSRLRRAVNEDVELCSSSLLDLPIRAEERVRVQLGELTRSSIDNISHLPWGERNTSSKNWRKFYSGGRRFPFAPDPSGSWPVANPRTTNHEATAYPYDILGTLGDRSGALTCSEYIAKLCNIARVVRKYPTFEHAAEALKGGRISAMLVPGAYPNAFKFIQDRAIRCDRVFIRPIPPLVLAGRDRNPPHCATTLFYHPATEPLLKHVKINYRQASETTSNAVSARVVTHKQHCIAITNVLCAEHYRLTIYKTLSTGTEMPWLIFVSR